MEKINARVSLVKASIGGVPVALCANQSNAMLTVEFVKLVDSFTLSEKQLKESQTKKRKKRHGALPWGMLRRALLFIKAWFKYERSESYDGCLLDSKAGGISTHALQVLVISMFNLHAGAVASPLHALILFAHTYQGFSWNRYGVSVGGLVECATGQLAAAPEHVLIPHSLLHDCQMQIMMSPPPGCPYSFRHTRMNIIDPLLPSNNLGISCSAEALAGFEGMLVAIKELPWGNGALELLQQKWEAWGVERGGVAAGGSGGHQP